ncbi:preprotein translocase subunit SecA [Desulfovibrio litoralis]|uniref:Protein translocase subunit SecA n=1 Tax=Desulfovibrio litoralis DSM 11393 TaxID=1121455 RepID=A0A1M7TJ14_9BACT|nr:preprotein translocase subunit SecA [Desulfovibrio litoralis]SHN70707.1 protein translocase subunit secA [Desulfovibrio litoralis DSM 11393]
MFGYIIRKVFGTRNERYLKGKLPLVTAINKLEPEMQALADADFPKRIMEYKERIAKGESLEKLLPEVFALTREASVRALNMRHFDVQLIGGIVLNSGRIAEMRTGEGKTLVATLPVVLNALSGKGVHVITVNDYLAKRDAEWMGKLYNFLGLSVGVVVHGLTDAERQQAYGSDITYGTNNEFGFDYLRDNMKFYPEQLVQRELNFAIVDEVDSILIDEARTPLIISGAADQSTEKYNQIDTIIPRLKDKEHYTIDEKAKSAALTDEGVAFVEELLNVENLFDAQNITLQHHVLQALKAHKVFKRDVDYIVQNGEVVIIDEFRGRAMEGRRFSDGLHQALEAKEHVKVEAENQTLASITFQNYFRMYKKLSGMTGTADTEAVEFQQIYGLEVVSIPTHRPMTRKDMPDVIYRSKSEKFDAIVKQIQILHEKGQPVLVGTISIENSEKLSDLLKKKNIPHNILNAKHHAQEAEIVAEAGQKGKVTIATNMAGRGTDIRLGEGVLELGGLFILGTERHESRRIDNQLRGRSGRQGDPGESRFFLSLEDDLMRIFGSERIMGIMESLGLKDGESIEHRLISRAIENAQKRVEAHNFEIRKSLLDYDTVMNQQREVIYALRRQTMVGDDLDGMVHEFADDALGLLYADFPTHMEKASPEEKERCRQALAEAINFQRVWHREELPSKDEAMAIVTEILEELKKDAAESYNSVVRYFILEELDRSWKEHLFNMDHLRDGIGLRGYGQRDPRQEYKREGFELFQALIGRIRENVIKLLTRVRIRFEEQEQQKEEVLEQESSPSLYNSLFKHSEPSQSVSYSSPQTVENDMSSTHKNKANQKPLKRNEPKLGRNDDCPCGSGKKYKKCCGKDK